MAEDFDNHRRIFDAWTERVEGASMIFKAPPQLVNLGTFGLASAARSSREAETEAAEQRNPLQDMRLGDWA